METLKYLGEIIKEEVGEIKENTLIISPVGSGKTHFVKNDLSDGKSTLYLCDTTNLREQVQYDMRYKDNFTTMTYARFGMEVDCDVNNSFIKQYDIIIADEIHNLIDYMRFRNNKREEKYKDFLSIAFNKLLGKYDSTIIVMFTATPYYLQKKAEEYNKYNKIIDENFIHYDYTNRKDIVKYTETFIAYINHYTDVKKRFEECLRGDYIWYEGNKILVFTRTINVMNKIYDICHEINNGEENFRDELRPICLWSTHNENMPLDSEQERVRQHLIKTGELAEEYNVLIVNRAMESGINITDKRMQVVVTDTNNPTQIIQARGRVRHNINLLILKTKDDSKKEIELDEKIIGKWIVKDEILKIISNNNMRDNKGRLIGVKAFPTKLEKYGYHMESKRKTINGKKITMYCISKK